MKVRRVVTKKDSERTRRKPKCSVWQHFRDMSNSVSAIRLDCIYCSQSFSYRNATKMKKHLANICKSCPLDIKNAHKELDDGTVRPYRRRVPSLPGMHDCCWPGCDLKFAKL